MQNQLSSRTERKVYFITDRSMLNHKCEWCPLHIECPERLQVILDRLESVGIIDECIRLKSASASIEDIQLVHPTTYIDRIMSTKQMNLEELEQFSSMNEDIYVNKDSFDAALMSVGCALEATKAVITNPNSAAFAAIRPPGHHASAETPCGFCIFNNVAICAKKARQLGVERVLILDWDVHAGQGTQYSIEDDPNIKLISIHRYESGHFWPNLSESAVENSYGNTVNMPLNEIGYGDKEYNCIINKLVLPIISDFRPSLVLISCGFDAALGDCEGEMTVTPGGYQLMLNAILRKCATIGAPVCLLLEGGYFLDSVAVCAEFCLKALLRKPLPNFTSENCSNVFLTSLHRAINHYSSRFPNLQLLREVTDRLRARHSLSKIVFDRCEYKSERKLEFPQETRQIYPPRPEDVEESYRKELQRILSEYTYESMIQNKANVEELYRKELHRIVNEYDYESVNKNEVIIEITGAQNVVEDNDSLIHFIVDCDGACEEIIHHFLSDLLCYSAETPQCVIRSGTVSLSKQNRDSGVIEGDIPFIADKISDFLIKIFNRGYYGNLKHFFLFPAAEDSSNNE